MHEATTTHKTQVTVGVRELKNQLSRYLDQVKAGADVMVTQHGTPIARLSAIGTEVSHRQALIEAGIVVPAEQPQRRLPKKRVELAPGPSVVELAAWWSCDSELGRSKMRYSASPCLSVTSGGASGAFRSWRCPATTTTSLLGLPAARCRHPPGTAGCRALVGVTADVIIASAGRPEGWRRK